MVANRSMPISKYQGYTLIELMIALVLGLLITAAVVQIYIINVRTKTVQQGGSDIQNASVFGLQNLENHIRIANLGNPKTVINSRTANGGVVLTGYNVNMYTPGTKGDGSDDVDNNSDIEAKLRTYSNDTKGTATGSKWTGVSNTDKASDQLTIQYTNTTGQVIPDCEGRDVAANATVIERYFLREANGATGSSTLKKLVLACDSGRVTQAKNAGKNTLSDFGDAGQEFIVGVDQFKVLLGTQQDAEMDNPNTMNYLTPAQYLALNPLPEKDNEGNITDSPTQPPITAIKIGLLASGNQPTVGSGKRTEFDIFGVKNTIADTNDTRVRNTYESTTLMRNARVININMALK